MPTQEHVQRCKQVVRMRGKVCARPWLRLKRGAVTSMRLIAFAKR